MSECNRTRGIRPKILAGSTQQASVLRSSLGALGTAAGGASSAAWRADGGGVGRTALGSLRGSSRGSRVQVNPSVPRGALARPRCFRFCTFPGGSASCRGRALLFLKLWLVASCFASPALGILCPGPLASWVCTWMRLCLEKHQVWATSVQKLTLFLCRQPGGVSNSAKPYRNPRVAGCAPSRAGKTTQCPPRGLAPHPK